MSDLLSPFFLLVYSLVVVFCCCCWLACLSDTKTSNAHPATIAGSLRAEVHAVMQFLAVAPLIFDQFVIARRCLQRRPAIIVCRRVWDLRFNLADWSHPSVWFVHFAGDTQAVHVRDEFHGRMLSSCVCAFFSRWRKPLMYSSSGSFCFWCISSNARKTSTRCFFSITRSACSNSRTTALYRAFVAAGFELISSVFIIVGFL